ncbi:hypothetical protein PPL_02096 [Heterostelium album PN500]|uniref:FNIP repeat-containing protein n=1 Tax=Heterostelium pallidum (strain ATCC 26659 / Pp 5 / PN500) TaxID=670386 RepID=D3B1C5_HETP5|nr:hypothetical protein PPL_02096 [Heterostelium album PN500]EFA85099.1 hypothetical protein PPL_02096 [Heterostelium album PN500]|eukprot:XP_020437208.1 hypothetical protein PPL_02096 [Heterostelium album PN500]
MNDFSNISLYLLKKIFSYIDSNFDKLCISLICKSFYIERDSYFNFHNDQTLPNKEYIKGLNLNSYQKFIDNPIELSNLTVSLVDSDRNDPFSIKIENLLSDDSEIPMKYGKVNFNNSYFLDQPMPVLRRSHHIKELSFGYRFNQVVLKNDVLPPYLEKLFITVYKPLERNCFPESLVDLTLQYNHPLTYGALPPNLLELGLRNYEHDIEPGVLPDSLKTLYLSAKFDKPLKVGSLPPNLEFLSLGYQYNKAIEEGVIPRSLKSLNISQVENLTVKFPPDGNLQTIHCHHSFLPQVPESVTKITIDFGVAITGKLTLPNIRSLTIDNMIGNIPRGYIPSTVTKLHMGRNFKLTAQSLRDVLPPGLKILKTGHDYNHIIEPGDLPESLERLELGYFFSQPLKVGSIPKNVKHVLLVNITNETLSPGVLPDGLETLEMRTVLLKGNVFIEPGWIPNSVQNLIMGDTDSIKYDAQSLPTSLYYLKTTMASMIPFEQLPESTQIIDISDTYDEYQLRRISRQNFLFYGDSTSAGFVTSSFIDHMKKCDKEEY